MADQDAPDPEFLQRYFRANKAVQGIPGLIMGPGGVLIQFGKETVGAIGVGGSAGPVADEVCAKAGIDKIKDRLQ